MTNSDSPFYRGNERALTMEAFPESPNRGDPAHELGTRRADVPLSSL